LISGQEGVGNVRQSDVFGPEACGADTAAAEECTASENDLEAAAAWLCRRCELIGHLPDERYTHL
jgi:hypothetical protein